MEQERRASEARLRSILETAPDSIMMVDRAGKILFINRARAPLVTSEVVGRSCFDFVPAESHHRVAAALDRVFTRRMLDEYEVRSAPTPDGDVELTIPPGSAAGRKLRLRGKGIPASSPGGTAGDLYVVLTIALPPSGSDAARRAYEAFKAAFDFDPRAGLKGATS